MSLTMLTAPAVEPVTLAEAKTQLKLDCDDDDALVLRLISAARVAAEQYTRRALLTQSWQYWRDDWPSGPIRLAFPPLQEVTAVTCYDIWDNAHMLGPALYRIEHGIGGARLAFKECVVSGFNLRRFDTLSISFTCGYGDGAAAVPEAIRQAILALVTNLYVHRGDTAPTPELALALLEPFRVASL